MENAMEAYRAAAVRRSLTVSIDAAIREHRIAALLNIFQKIILLDKKSVLIRASSLFCVHWNLTRIGFVKNGHLHGSHSTSQKKNPMVVE